MLAGLVFGEEVDAQDVLVVRRQFREVFLEGQLR
jgi:hypothetical protein